MVLIKQDKKISVFSLSIQKGRGSFIHYFIARKLYDCKDSIKSADIYNRLIKRGYHVV